MTISQIVHKRGGTHHSHGIFQGGAELNSSYQMKPKPSYRYSTQLRNTKSLEKIESHLHSNMKDTTIVKFNGKMETSKTSSSNGSRTELDKEEFISEVQDMVQRYGLQSFFSIPGSGNTMKNLTTEPHSFTFTEVLEEHESRNRDEPPSTFDSTQTELLSSVVDRFKCYDVFEIDDFNLSRLVIESLISADLRQKVKTRFNHFKDFAYLPGQVYFMMILEVCNASFTFDIDGARTSLTSIKLVDYPGENISDFADESLRLIKILQGGYSLPYQLGSQLLRKVCETQSMYFNRNMYSHYDKALSMERSHGPHKDPKLLETHPLYSEYGPVGVCNIMQREYALLVQQKDWPALRDSIPEGNFTPQDGVRKNPHGMLCHICQDDTHFANTCPLRGSNGGGGKQSGHGSNSDSSTQFSHGSGTGSGKGNSTFPPMRNGLPFKEWKYIHPSDLNDTFILDGKRYYFCAKCVCTRTRKVGFYNISHSTDNHQSGLGRRSRIDNSNGSGNNNSNPPNQASNSTDSRPGASLSPVDETRTHSPSTTTDTLMDVDDPGGLEFQGAFLTPFDEYSNDDGAWMACVYDTSSAEPPSEAVTTTLGLWDEESAGDNSGYEDAPQAATEANVTTLVKDRDIVSGLITSRHLTYEELVMLLDLAQNKPRNPQWPDNVLVSAHGYTRFDVGSHIQLLPNNRFKTGNAYYCNHCNNMGPYYLPCNVCSYGCFAWSDINGSTLDDEHIVSEFRGDGNEWRVADATSTSDTHPPNDTNESPFDAYLSTSFPSSTLSTTSTCRPSTLPTNTLSSIQPTLFTTYFHPFWTWVIRFLHMLLRAGFSSIITAYLLFGKLATTSLSSWYTYLLLVSILVWDTLELYILSPPTLPTISRRSSRFRSKSGIYLRGYPKGWMMLSFFMFSLCSSLCHPMTLASAQVVHTFDRAQGISNLVDVNSSLLFDYHHQRYTLFSRLSGNSALEGASCLSDSVPHVTSSICINDANDHLQFLTPYQTLQELEGECDDLDFYDSVLATEPNSAILLDWLQLDHLCDDIVHLSDDDTNSMVINPSLPAAFNSHLLGKVDLLPSSPSASFPVIFDSGASLAISPSLSDFSGPITKFTEDKRLGGMANGMLIEGIGNIQWSFRAGNKLLVVHSRCYYVPDSKARLISPQRLFNKAKGIEGTFTVMEEHAILTYKNVAELIVEYCPRSHLPLALAKNLSSRPAANLTVLDDSNQNLTPSQKVLLTWHARFGHKGFSAIQRLFRHLPFASAQFISASKCEIPKCEVCEYSKAHRQPTKGNKQQSNSMTDGALKANHLRAGAAISVDHFESRLKGRTYTSFGKTTSDQYVGGCIFVDHMSGYIHVEPQLGFSSSETVRAKQSFEKFALDNGVLVEEYMADNGVFKANAFVKHIQDHNQKLKFCGVNAHHQNAVAERSIRTVSECARSMLLHASMRWKDGIDSSLWPMAVSYATYLYNHLPQSNGVAPADLFMGTQIPRHKLKDMHTWGCPVYVLDPKLQQGKKLPRWEPKSRKGIFLGFSPYHASDVPLVLNLTSGHISPQYHVVFDDGFDTVISHSSTEDPPSFWQDIGVDDALYEQHVHRIPLDRDSTVSLDPEWLTPDEREERVRMQARQSKIRVRFAPTVNLPAESPDPSAPSDLVPLSTSSVSQDTSTSATTPTPMPTTTPTPTPTPSSPPPSGLRRSSRSNKGQYSETRYINEVFLTSARDTTISHHTAQLAYQAEVHTDLSTGESHVSDPRAYAAKHKISDPDMPTYHEALSGEHAADYAVEMKKEIRQLIKQRTWESIPRSKVPLTSSQKRRKILSGTWAFKLKRLPDGSPSRFKARYCVRGDQQTEGVDYFETYAPVVQWSTVRMVLTMILANGWATKQVDYTNAFAQADLEEEVYIEPPKGFGRKDGIDMVLRLIKSLYGLKQAPKSFYDKLRSGLIERGFTQSNVDPCLFMKHNMICLIYVDDTILTGPDLGEIEKLIKDLGVKSDDHLHTFELRDEGEVGDFLGIRIEKTGDKAFTLSQTGLIDKVLKTSGMEECNSSPTPTATSPIGSDKEGASFCDTWEYATVVGMLMFLASNSRPDIAYAVHQCARFTHCPKQSHGAAVKRIIRYLKGTRTKGMTLTPSKKLSVDCFVDADFAGLWNHEDEQDATSVKSRSGYLLMFMGCPLIWGSKLQTQIALSTMEAEYIALSLAMRELIGLRALLKDIYTTVLCDPKGLEKINYNTIAKTFGEIPQSIVHEDNQACLKFASIPRMSPRTKHIAIPYHFFREKVEALEIKVIAVNTENQLADQFTKGLPQPKFVSDRKRLMGW
jgi:hypothetical protein